MIKLYSSCASSSSSCFWTIRKLNVTDITICRDITVKEISHLGTDEMIVQAARVSTGAVTKESDKDDHAFLINYLMKHRHGTPFEHGTMVFFVHAPLFVFREWHRHRIGFSYNEESGRYKQLDPVFYLPHLSRPMIKNGTADNPWKPGRPKFRQLATQKERESFASISLDKIEVYKAAYASYEKALAAGLDPGLARIDLPVGIFSSMWVTCNPRSIMAFLSLRTHEPDSTFVSYPLWEIDNAARQIEDFFASRFPLTHAAFVANGRVSP